MKKFLIALLVLLLAVGGVFLAKNLTTHSKTVEVTPVSSMNYGWMGDETTLSGYIREGDVQSIYVEPSQLVQAVYSSSASHPLVIS